MITLQALARTLINLYRFRGLVCEFRRPDVAYLDLPCMSGNEFVREFVLDTSGNDVVPVRWHLSTTSLKTTNHRSFLFPMPVPAERTSLSRRNDVLPLTFFVAITGGGVDALVDVDSDPSRPTMSCLSSTSSREGFGIASCFTLSRPSIRAKTSLVLSRSSFWIFSSSIFRTIFSTSATVLEGAFIFISAGISVKEKILEKKGVFEQTLEGL